MTLLGSAALLSRVPLAGRLPLFTSRISCGFPSPAEDCVESMTSLDEIAVVNPAATYLMLAGGDSMTGAGIYPQDVIVVDRSVRAKHRSIVTAVYNGEFVCKRLLEAEGGIVLLAPENPSYPPIVIPNPEELVIWGVCTFNLHDLRRQ
ncbi:TPA: translesion error-prone DNA polymerase V autoproteolytic subunit [Pseudomonas aeruginosa]|nr:translesion error-prone DNA polymerase V autoproteolytic subunit [Pseudomonas aeruginosa]